MKWKNFLIYKSILIKFSNLHSFILLFFVSIVGIYSTERTFPSYNEYRSNFTSSEAILLDRNGIPLQSIRTDFQKRSYIWLELDDFPSYLIEAILATEDKNYWDHPGVDTIALLTSLYSGLRGWGLRGGSTISMQLVSLMDPSLGSGGTKRTVAQKIRQIQAASALEEVWSKEQILTAYLNVIPLRGEKIGVPIASLQIWNTASKAIDKKMCLLIASMIRAPNASLKLISERSFRLSQKLNWNYTEDDLKTFTELSLASKSKLNTNATHSLDSAHNSKSELQDYKQGENLAFHYANQFASQKSGNVKTSLDFPFQKHAYDSLRKNLSLIQDKNVKDGAVLVLDNKTGEVLVYVGGVQDFSSAKYVDAIQSFRQAGSTLKPFLYALAIEKKYITATSILLDAPLDIDVTRGMYRPSNYDKEFVGPVFAKQALASSLNIPAVRLVQMIGVDSFFERIQSLGFQNLKDSDYYGYSLALGTLDVSLWDLTWAYWTLANSGKDKMGKSIYSPDSSFIVSNILSNRMNRSLTFGLENSLSTRYWTVAKTGTSQDMRDNWCVGYSNHYTVGVWIGNFSGEPMHNVTGITGAAPIWREVMDYLHSNNSSQEPNPPPNLKQVFDDYYLKGTEPKLNPMVSIQELQESNQNQSPKIEYPIDGMIVAYDPDIPEDFQKILFQAKGNTQGLFWNLNDKVLGDATKSHSWQVQKGKFKLQLIKPNNQIIQSLSFEVR
jgi:penicillin-binding protein 1C